MAVIRFDPTWVASVDYATGEYRYDYPLVMDGTQYSKDAYFGIDIDEMARLMRIDPGAEARFFIQTSVGGRQLRFRTHNNVTPPTPTEGIDINLGSTSGGVYDVIDNYMIRDLNATFPYFNSEREEWVHSLVELSDAGVKGGVLEGVLEVFTTNEIFAEIEGDYDNPRPALRTPTGGVMRAVDEYIRFRWQHNSPLKQIAFELQYRVKGAIVWETIQVETGTWGYFLEPNTLTPNNYEWRVRTTSEYGFVSPWSLLGTFTVAEITPSPVYVTPIEGQVMGTADLKVQWDSVDQNEYHIRVLETSDAHTYILMYEDKKISNIQEITLPSILVNGGSYRVMLRVNQAGGIFSAWNSIDITVEYTPPAMPVVTLTPNKETASLEIDVYNPLPTGTEPNVIKQELFRREQGGEWIKLANLLSNSAYVDHALASGKMYEYKLILYGDNNTLTTSDIFTGSVGVKHSQLNLTSDPAQMVRLMYNPDISFSNNYSATSKHFAGRKKTVTEFREMIEQSGVLGFVVDKDTLNKLYGFLALQETMLFRDMRGKRVFVTVSDMAVNYHKATDLYEISLNLTEVYYKEGID